MRPSEGARAPARKLPTVTRTKAQAIIRARGRVRQIAVRATPARLVNARASARRRVAGGSIDHSVETKAITSSTMSSLLRHSAFSAARSPRTNSSTLAP